MTEFLLLLGKVNLALGVGIILVWLLRRPVRAQFGAAIAYALWLLVPVAGLACLLPVRTEAPVMQVAPLIGQNPVVQMPVGQMPARQMPVVQMPVGENRAAPAAQMQAPAAATPPSVPAQVTQSGTTIQSMMADEMASLDFFDVVPLLFAVWILGAGLMALYLARLQARFRAAERAGEAGPAVAGFLRPRVVIPKDFPAQFTQAEQAAILAHERVHLARQDARINALSALMRALCWFNPLIHLADHWLRIDQELACDAAAMAGRVSRRDYANALLKSQITKTALPLGCNWPGSEHPLVERVALLKRKRPGPARRVIGFGLVMIAAVFAGLGAWAAQPAVPAKFIPAPAPTRVVLAEPSIPTPATPQPAANIPPPAANPVSSFHPDAAAPNDAIAHSQSSLPVIQQPDQKIDLALNNASDAALAKAAADASSALSDRTVARQPAANATPPAAADSNSVSVQPPRTEAALLCTLGLKEVGCEAVFENGVMQCTRLSPRAVCEPFPKGGNYLEHVRRCNGPDGSLGERCPLVELETVKYLGTEKSGNDVYDVKYRLGETTFSVSIGTGGVAYILSFSGPPAQVIPSVAITSPADQLLYSRQNACRKNNGDCDAAKSGPEKAAADTSGAVSSVIGETAAGGIIIVSAGSSPAPPVSGAAGATIDKASRPKTETGLDCMVGLGPQGCEKVFGKPADHQYSQCTTQRVQDNCPYGELETVEYLGANVYGADVYGVNWKDLKSIFILPPPGQDGKIGHGPWRRTAADLRVTAPAGQILYSRETACRQNNWDCAASPVAIAVSGPAPAGGLRPEIRQQLDRAEDLFKDSKPAAAMDVLRSVEAVPHLNRDEQRRAGIVRNFITPYSASAFRGPPGPNGGFDMPSAEELMRASPRVSSYLPPGDVGPNNPN